MVVSANPTDVRVLVDVSGSMKKQTRKPSEAQRRLCSQRYYLISPRVESGSSDLTYDSSSRTVLLMRAGMRLDNQSRHPSARLIDSRTWRVPSDGITAGGERTTGVCHVILITDGIVDVQGGKDASSASRDRILKQCSPMQMIEAAVFIPSHFPTKPIYRY